MVLLAGLKIGVSKKGSAKYTCIRTPTRLVMTSRALGDLNFPRWHLDTIRQSPGRVLYYLASF